MDVEEPCEHLPLESKIFGVPTARVRGDGLTPQRAKEIDQWCRRNKIAWLFFAVRSDDAQTTRLVEDGGFRLVEVRVTCEKQLTDAVSPGSPASVRPFIPSDLPALERLARSSYTDSRFYYDTHVSREKCGDWYAFWTREACEESSRGGSAVFVANEDGRPVGYVACAVDANSGWGRMNLMAVDESLRGRGVGQSLTQAALNWAIEKRLPGLMAVTLGRNIAIQRLFQRFGFLTRSLQLYYHKWYEL